MDNKKLDDLIKKMQLPDDFLDYIPLYIAPLAEQINLLTQQKNVPLIGINGSQGSGKSTIAAILKLLLENNYRHRVVVLSIDDFYHTKFKRSEMAQDIHPLFTTRGVPGTHDIDLASNTINQLKTAGMDEIVRIPRFDKAVDDRKAEHQWDEFIGSAMVIILEGWCIGASAQEDSLLLEPINELERNEDPQGIWRRAVNINLANQYQQLFEQIDWLLMLKAPGFDCVFNWRLLQEQKLEASLDEKDNKSGLLTKQQLRRFIEHYQRITEHCLTDIPGRADAIIYLDQQHTMTRLQFNTENG